MNVGKTTEDAQDNKNKRPSCFVVFIFLTRETSEPKVGGCVSAKRSSELITQELSDQQSVREARDQEDAFNSPFTEIQLYRDL